MTEQLLKLDLLGGFQASLNGTPLDGFVSNKSRALLAYLFLTQKPQSRQVLAELFWGDKSDEMANANLRMALSNLRALVGTHLAITRSEVAVRENSLYLLDVDSFRNKLGNLAAPTVETTASALEEAVELYQGDFLEGFHVRDADGFEEWALRHRERYRQLALQALFRLSKHHTERGNYGAAIEYTSRLLALEPWQEEGHRQMMLLYALTGNRSAALAQYETCRRILAQELQVQPLPETNALLARIKAMPGGAQQPAAQASVKSRLFGREDEHAWLLQQWKQVQQRRGRLALIEGEMGIGKTSLVEEALRYVTANGATVLRARCHEFGNEMPYQGIVDLLRMGMDRQPESLQRLAPVWRAELAPLLPELYERMARSKASAPAPTAEVARHRLFEAVYQFLHTLTGTHASCSFPATGGHEPELRASKQARLKGQDIHDNGFKDHGDKEQWLVVFLDDLQWIDAATVDLLRYLVYRLHECPIWFVGAYQSDGLDAEHPFLKLRRALVGEGRATVLRLERLSAHAIVDWVRALPGLEVTQVQQLAAYVARRSEGNPFITSQILNEMRNNASLLQSNGIWRLGPSWSPQDCLIPFAVREIVLLKLGRLSTAARELLCEAAAIGENFDAATLEQVAADRQKIRAYLNECLEQGLITAASPHTYRFTHLMIREIAYERLSPWHRLQVHSRLGQDTGQAHLRRMPVGVSGERYALES